MVQPRRSLRRGERGQALTEYAVVVAVIAVCLMAILGLVGRATKRAYERTASSVSMPSTTGYPAGSSGGGGGVVLTNGGGGRGKSRPEVPPADSVGDGGSTEIVSASATEPR